MIAMVLILLVVIFAGIPVPFAISFASIVTLMREGIATTVFAQNLVLGVNSFPLLAIPLFLVSGKLMNSAGITNRIFGFIHHLVGPIRGGLGHVNILSSVVFAGMSGSATADAAGLGLIEIKAMRDAGYDSDFSVAITAASATIGPIIPPSIIMVVFGIAAEVSIGRMFIGGIVPGLLLALTLMVITWVIARRRGYPRQPRSAPRVVLASFLDALPALIAPVIIIGGILGGVFTATEAGGIAVVYAVFVGTFVYRELTWKGLYTVLLDSAVTSAVVLLIIGAAKIFAWILAFHQVPTTVAATLVGVTENPLALTLLLVAMYLFLGTIMEAAAIVVMTVPVLMPVLQLAGIDPVMFGVIVAVCMSIGTLTPPIGIVMYVLCDIGEISMRQYLKAVFPFLIGLIGVILLLVLIPELVTFLPNYFLP